MNLFENLTNMNETTSGYESVDNFFDVLIDKINDRYYVDVVNSYYEIENWPQEFKSEIIVNNCDDVGAEDIKVIILYHCRQFENVDIMIDCDSNDNPFEAQYLFQISAYNENDLWDRHNEELKLNENEELLEVKLSNEEGMLTDNDEKELNKIGEEVTNGINKLIRNKDKLAKLLPKYVDDLNNEFNIRDFIGDEVDTHDWLYSEGIIDKDNTLVYENAMIDEIKSIKDSISGYTARDLYKEYRVAKSNIDYWMHKIEDIDKD